VAGQRTGRPRSPALWLVFGLAGRISRRVYWPCYIALLLLNIALYRQLRHLVLLDLLGGGSMLLIMLGAIVVVYAQIAVSVKRLHDIGYGGFLAAAVLIPFVNLVFNIWVGLLPGTAGPNRFGEQPDAPPA
jgi:uncharacterized membrane protein YhaH (DUF805 family)